jgi:hypothetical protein
MLFFFRNIDTVLPPVFPTCTKNIFDDLSEQSINAINDLKIKNSNDIEFIVLSSIFDKTMGNSHTI